MNAAPTEEKDSSMSKSIARSTDTLAEKEWLRAVTAEAAQQYPYNHMVDDPFGATGEAQSDPYGYDDTARDGFIAGAQFEASRFTTELETAPVTGQPGARLLPITMFASWLASGERGLSSEAIVQKLTGHKVGRDAGRGDHPHDVDDFRRCERLLREVPYARAAFRQMGNVSPVWARLVTTWDEIVALIEAEAPGRLDAGSRGPASPVANMRIRELIHPAKENTDA